MASLNDVQECLLEALCLGIYSDAPETRLLLKGVSDVYDSHSADKSEFQTDMAKMYAGLIRDLGNAEIDLSNKAEIAAVMLKFKQNPAIVKDPSILEELENIFKNRDLITARRITNMQKSVRNWTLRLNDAMVLRKMYASSRECSKTTDKIKQDLHFNEVLAHARQIVASRDDNPLSDDTIEFIDMSCKKSVKKGLDSYNYKRHDKVWRSGLQGVNRMFGPNGGAAPGEFIGYAALSHHYKSGILQSWFRWLTTLNTPGRMNGKIPVVLFISLENEVFENQMTMFREAYTNLYNEEPPADMSNSDIIDYVSREYSAKGFRPLMYRKDGGTFGYPEYVSLIEQLHTEGYKVVVSIIDYITLMKMDPAAGNDAKQLQTICNRVGNYGNHHGITTITGLQLDTQARILSDSGMTDCVKRFGPSHLADCKGVTREFDFFAFMHIQDNLGIPYLTMNWAKHRYNAGTKKEHKYAAWRFGAMGIMDDVNGADTTISNIYTEGSPEEGSAVAEESGALF